MVQLEFFSGSKAGTRWVARRFPVRIGRAATNDLCLEEDGVWDEHLRLEFLAGEGYSLAAGQGALVTVNSEPVQAVLLRNGDTISLGSVRMRFWLAEVRQRGLRLRELFVWTLIGAVALGQIVLVYWLLQ